MLKVKRESEACTIFCDNLLSENERLKEQLQTEVNDKQRITEKLDRAEMKIDKLQKTLLKSKSTLSAAHTEISILRDPQVRYIEQKPLNM